MAGLDVLRNKQKTEQNGHSKIYNLKGKWDTKELDENQPAVR